MGKRKYPKVQGYWVYSIHVSSVNKYYIGVSKQKCSQRWQKSMYLGKSLEPYLEEWESMIKTVLVDNLTRDEALKMEDALIQVLDKKGLCVNSNRSGLITSDVNAYNREYIKQYRENNTEFNEYEKQYKKQYNKQYYENNKEQIKQQVKQYYENNKEKIKEYDKQRHKQRYENDAEYRERVKQQSKQYKLKKKLEKQKQLN